MATRAFLDGEQKSHDLIGIAGASMLLAVGHSIHVSAVGAMATKAPSILLSISRLRHSSGTLESGPGWKRRSLLLSAAAASLLDCRNSVAAGPSFDPVTDREREASAVVSRRVSDAIRLLDLARDLQAKGDYSQALDYFTLVRFSPRLYVIDWPYLSCYVLHSSLPTYRLKPLKM